MTRQGGHSPDTSADCSKPLLDSTRSGFLVAGPTQLAARVIGFATTIILARQLSVGDFGVYNLLFGASAILGLFTNAGLASSLQRFVPEYFRSRQYARLLKTFFFSQAFRAVTGVVLVALLVGLFDYYAPLLKLDDHRFTFVIFCLNYLAFCQVEFLQIVFQGMLMQVWAAFGDAVRMAARLVFIVILLAVVGSTLTTVFYAELMASVLICIVMWMLFLAKGYRPLKPLIEEPSTIERRRVARFSLWSAATIPGTFIFGYGSDYFVVSAMAASDQLGVYSLASRAITMLMLVAPSHLLQNVIRPVFYQRYYSVDDRNAELNRMFNSLVVLIASIVMPLLALAGVQAKSLLVLVFGSDFAASTPVFLVLAAANVFAVVELPCDLVLQAVEKVQARLCTQVFAIYNIVAAVLLMRTIGIMGVALATGSAYVATCVMWYLLARHWSGIRIRWGGLLRIAANTAVATSVAYWVGRLGESPLWAVASVVVGLGVYLAMSRVNNFLDEDEKALANRFLRRQVFRV